MPALPITSLMNYRPIVEEIVFSPRNFKSTTRRVRTNWINAPEDIAPYEDVQITMFCSKSMLTQQYLSVWKNLVFNTEGEYYNPMYEYKKNIEVYFYGATYAPVTPNIMPIFHFTLQGCYPERQTRFSLKYTDNPKRLTISQTFKVDKIVFDRSYAESAALKEILNSPTSVLDTMMSSLIGTSGENYTTTETYS